MKKENNCQLVKAEFEFLAIDNQWAKTLYL